MKKQVIGVTVVITLLLGLIIFGYTKILQQSEEIVQTLDELKETIGHEDWQQASQVADKLEDQWHKTIHIWGLAFDHNEIDMLNNSLIRVIHLARTQSSKDSLTEIEVSRYLVQHIPETERLSINNIF